MHPFGEVPGELTGYALLGSYRKFDGHGQSSFIHGREELGLETGSEQCKNCCEDGKGSEYDGLPVGNGPADENGVPTGKVLEETLDRIEDSPVELSGLGTAPQESRTQHRHQGKCGRGGDDHDDAHYPSELLEYDSGQSRHHCKR